MATSTIRIKNCCLPYRRPIVPPLSEPKPVVPEPEKKEIKKKQPDPQREAREKFEALFLL
jgi:hypothetical protein